MSFSVFIGIVTIIVILYQKDTRFQNNKDVKLQIEKFKKLEHMYIPENINYNEIKGISNIARAGLNEVRPLSIGEATRISGVTSNDITLIIAHMNDK